ncbi:MAG: cation diffusion facilitator family transporter [Reyranellaceae bacterium]
MAEPPAAAPAAAPATDPAVAAQLSQRARLMRLASIASTAVAVVLIAGKAVAWWYSGSVSLLSTLLDSTLDLLASLVTLLSVRHALMPADREHRFGHGKAEALAGLIQSGFIGASAIWLLISAGERFLDPQPVRAEALGMAVMIGSIALTALLVVFQRRVVSRTGSLAIGADRMHYQSDLLTNVGVILAIALSSRFDVPLADPIVAGLIGLYILKSAADIGKDAYNVLMDRELSTEDRERIKAIVRADPRVRGLYDLRTRSSGVTTFIQLHMELDPATNLRQAHEIGEAVEAEIRRAFPSAEIIVHQDPEGVAATRAGRP